ncbi:hypothetical protein AVEN_97818-1, partial [Araneus ventricosus]
MAQKSFIFPKVCVALKVVYIADDRKPTSTASLSESESGPEKITNKILECLIKEGAEVLFGKGMINCNLISVLLIG